MTAFWRLLAVSGLFPAAVFSLRPAYRIGRLKIFLAHTMNSALALSTTRLHTAYFLSYGRQRIHFGFAGGLSQVAQPLPPSWRFSIAARRWRRSKRPSR